MLVFFRFAGCPACNIALPYYERELAPGLAALGASLTAISPQPHDRVAEIKQRHGLTFHVASDAYVLGGRLGLLFAPDAAIQAAMRARGTSLGELTGTGRWELPQSAVIVIGQDRVVRFVEVSPDWLVRTEAGPVLAAVRALPGPRRSVKSPTYGTSDRPEPNPGAALHALHPAREYNANTV